MAKNIEAGDEAVKERRTTAAKTSDHRVRKIVPLISEVNALRQSTYGELIKRGQANKMAKGWAERFFRRAQKARAAGAAENSPPPAGSPEPT